MLFEWMNKWGSEKMDDSVTEQRNAILYQPKWRCVRAWQDWKNTHFRNRTNMAPAPLAFYPKFSSCTHLFSLSGLTLPGGFPFHLNVMDSKSDGPEFYGKLKTNFSCPWLFHLNFYCHHFLHVRALVSLNSGSVQTPGTSNACVGCVLNLH